MVAFDLPVKTKKERRAASDFRTFLLKDGYRMMQFSLYVRPCVTFSRQETHVRRLRMHMPLEGRVQVIYITRAQWMRSIMIHGRPAKEVEPQDLPEQTLLW